MYVRYNTTVKGVMAHMRASDYVITPLDVWRGVRGLGIVRVGLLALACVGSVLALHRGISTELVLLVFSISTALLLRIDSRLPFVAAIILLVTIAALSAFDPAASGAKNTLQERLAVLVYYCLVLGVSLLIQEQMVAARQPAPDQNAAPAPQPVAPAPVPVYARSLAAPAAHQLHRSPAQPAVTPATRPPVRPQQTVAPMRSSVDGFALAPQPLLASPAVHRATAVPAAQSLSPQRAMPQASGMPHIRRATRRSIDGFVIRQSPAARAQAAGQFVGA